MEILTGKKGCDDVDKVVERWSNMLEKSPRGGQLEQVRVCAQIGIECTDSNPTMRPSTQDIINILDGTETIVEYIKTSGITSQPAIHSPTEMHQGISDSLGETSSKENVSELTVAGTNPCNSILESTKNLDKLSETMESLNPDIRRCLKYCNIFPNGSKIRRDELVRLWIVQGFVKTTCATDDMEVIANGYIQELVACSFLQPIETSSDTACFTIHDVVHGILDKVTKNFFRIENASSHEGEGWEGDVPRHIQHLFIQNSDGELITETIIGLEYLRTLIVYVVGKNTPIKEKVIGNICKRLPELRVLAIAFSQKQPNEFLVPESVGQLKHLRYFAFRTERYCTITLPSTLNKLQHIQLLDFGDGNISEFTFSELVNLRHLFFIGLVKLPYVGRLSSLQTLPGFRVSNEQGCELKQLRDLNKLRGSLRIYGLENDKSKGQALEANLAAKRLTHLTLRWNYEVTRCNPEVEANVIEGLRPPVGLKKLTLCNYTGWRYPDWMMGSHNGGPKYLQELQITGCRVAVPFSGLAEAFPHLRRLDLVDCSWDALSDNMVHLTSLKNLWIALCKNICSLPSLLQSLEEFTLQGCNYQFMKSCKTAGHPNWEKVEHIPEKIFLDQSGNLFDT